MKPNTYRLMMNRIARRQAMKKKLISDREKEELVALALKEGRIIKCPPGAAYGTARADWDHRYLAK